MIKKLDVSQLDTIMRIWLEGNLDAHPFIDPRYWQTQLPNVRSAIRQAEVYCYEKNGQICGFIGLQGHYIAGLFVARGSRDHGIGQQLLAFAQAHHQHLELDAYLRNQRAVNFYQQHHFKITQQTNQEVHLVWQA